MEAAPRPKHSQNTKSIKVKQKAYSDNVLLGNTVCLLQLSSLCFARAYFSLSLSVCLFFFASPSCVLPLMCAPPHVCSPSCVLPFMYACMCKPPSSRCLSHLYMRANRPPSSLLSVTWYGKHKRDTRHNAKKCAQNIAQGAKNKCSSQHLLSMLTILNASTPRRFD